MFRKSKRLDRLPPYMFGRLKEMTLRRRQEGEDVIDLSMGNPDRPTPPHIVEKLREVALDPKAHRYSASRGIYNFRKNVAEFYERRFGVSIDPETEAISVIGTKEGLSHLMIALLDEGDIALVPDPSFPIHLYSVVIAGASMIKIPLRAENEFVPDLAEITKEIVPKPKVLILSFPHNPTGAVVDIGFFEEVVDFARRNEIVVVHDLAYADIVFDDYVAPSIMQVKGAKDVAIEFFSLSKSYNMAGWRCGFAVGNAEIIAALAKIKGYYDYGIFTPIQVAGIMAMRSDPSIVKETAMVYQNRRDVLIEGLNRIGWEAMKPKATMFAWVPIPPQYREMGSFDFSMMLLEKANVTVSPGVGFGSNGEGYIRIALVENEQRIRQAIRQIKRALDLLEPK